MRWLFLMLALGCGAAAGYLGLFEKSSFSGYSGAQLDLLEQALAGELTPAGPPSRKKPPPPSEAQQQRVQDGQQRIQAERQRRRAFALALGGMGLFTLAAIFVRAGPSRFRLRAPAGEEARLLAAVGNPAVLQEGARQKAASLLGVAPDAPPAVIEAALQAQLQQRDPAKMTGLARELQEQALQQRADLVRARDLLLNKPSPGRTSPPQE
ncbi:hypothetical protein [Stigmatella aurantiaca]|uniref:Uncharacterized protein n=1 Tax=Stigmatella aurantiaca (strain DW4/3-1) TaxID=378806 RepID=Q08RY6_STIAD|nr:hypothetical protein [Stigmatella aurantiaca]ADO68368.1 uncharacterized protein STAUR_0564 [Stigmatella aurantiaca DW4/3-1]EAU63254.1 hypothetical protein STIAU_1640 [Stigmatella aurantiaca DW4/3-1]